MFDRHRQYKNLSCRIDQNSSVVPFFLFFFLIKYYPQKCLIKKYIYIKKYKNCLHIWFSSEQELSVR